MGHHAIPYCVDDSTLWMNAERLPKQLQSTLTR